MAAGASLHNTAVDCSTGAHINSNIFLICFHIAKDLIFALYVTESTYVRAGVLFSAVLMASVGMSLGVAAWSLCLLVLPFDLDIDSVCCIRVLQVQ